jgi:hypothetical protein
MQTLAWRVTQEARRKRFEFIFYLDVNLEAKNEECLDESDSCSKTPLYNTMCTLLFAFYMVLPPLKTFWLLRESESVKNIQYNIYNPKIFVKVTLLLSFL